jgi:hypothetical protein
MYSAALLFIYVGGAIYIKNINIYFFRGENSYPLKWIVSLEIKVGKTPWHATLTGNIDQDSCRVIYKRDFSSNPLIIIEDSRRVRIIIGISIFMTSYLIIYCLQSNPSLINQTNKQLNEQNPTREEEN